MGKDNDGEELEGTLPKDKIEQFKSGELEAVKATTSPVPKKCEEQITNPPKMKQIVEQEFHGDFTKQDLVDKVKTKYSEISEDQISPNDWSVNCQSGKRNKNAFLIRVGDSKYRKRNPSVYDGYKFINGMWHLTARDYMPLWQVIVTKITVGKSWCKTIIRRHR